MSTYWGGPPTNMKNFEQWNYGDGQRVILPSIKKGIISYEKAARSEFDYAFAHHPQARLMCNDLLTKTIDFLSEIPTVVEDLYHRIFRNCFGSRSPNKEARDTCWNIVTTLLVYIFGELCDFRVVAEDVFNHPDRSKELYLWVVLQSHRIMAEFLKENFTGHPKFHTQMVIFILETMVPRVELEGVSTACANFSALSVNVQKLASSVDAFDSCLHDLESTDGL